MNYFAKRLTGTLLVLLLGLSGMAWGQTIVSYDFSDPGAISGLNEASPGITVDLNIGFGSFKNSGTANPGIFSGQLRLYQNATKGGSIKIYANNGVTITQVIVHASGTTGPAAYTVDGGSATDLSSGTTYTMSSLSATSVVEFYQKDGNSSNRIYVDDFEVTYTTGGSPDPEPSDHADSFSASADDHQSITLTWTDNDGPQPADGFLVALTTDGSSTLEPSDGTPVGDSDGPPNWTRNVAHGTETVTISGLDAETAYYSKIWPYTNSGDDIDYKTDETVPVCSTTTDAAPETPALLISEVADPGDVYQARFVELYNNSGSTIDFASETWYLCRQTNGGLTWEDKQLTGTIAHGDVYISANSNDNESDYFYINFEFMADFDFGGSSGNGDDGYFLYYGGDHTTGILADAYGVIDIDGTGEAWEYEDSRAVRKNVTEGNPTWTASEWEITAADVADCTPGEIDHPFPAAIASHTFANGNNIHHGFDGTNVGLYFDSVNAGAPVTVNKFNNAPVNVSFSGETPANISSYRWVINAGGLGFEDGAVVIAIAGLPGITDPNAVDIYKRPTPGSGAFEKLTTTYDSENEWLTAPVSSFSEFILTSGDPDTPLPVSLTSFTAACVNGAVNVSWVTESETENAAFRVYRDNEMVAELEGAGTTAEPQSYLWTDNYVVPGKTYSYVLADVDYQGKETKHPEVEVEVQVEEAAGKDFTIGSAYPNPFNPVTVIPLNLAKDAVVTATLYDISGRPVQELQNGVLTAGSHDLKISGKDLSTGIYFVHISVNNVLNVRKIALMK